MDFDFTQEQERFRQEVRAWLAENVPADLRGRGFASSRADVKEVNKPSANGASAINAPSTRPV